MSEEFLGKRRRALEESFFQKRNAELLQHLKDSIAHDEEKTKLAAICGFQDQAVLEELMAQGIGCKSAAAISLVPMIHVAWADDNLESKEKDAILTAAEQLGLEKEGPAYKLLEGWLEEQPDEELYSAWCDYVSAITQTQDGPSKHAFKNAVLGRARGVAQAAGGILGLGEKVSSAEEAVLEKLERAFE